MQDGRIAIPSTGPGGLDGERSGHFGHCDVLPLWMLKEGRLRRSQLSPTRAMFKGDAWSL